MKLIDDTLFASAWVESRHHGRGLSGRALAAELRHRGVPTGDIEAAVGKLGPEQEMPRHGPDSRAAGRHAGSAAARADQAADQRARTEGLLPALAYRVVREALEQEGLDPADAGINLSDVQEPGHDGELQSW